MNGGSVGYRGNIGAAQKTRWLWCVGFFEYYRVPSHPQRRVENGKAAAGILVTSINIHVLHNPRWFI